MKSLLIPGIILLGAVNTYALEKDTTLTPEEYYQFGFPQKVQTVIDLDFIQLKLLDLTEIQKGILPEYHSIRSGVVFRAIFSEQTVDNIIRMAPNNAIAMHAHLAIQQKLDLSKSPYMGGNPSRPYDYEVVHISLIDVYNMVKALELLAADKSRQPRDARGIDTLISILEEKLDAYFGEITRKMWKGFSEKDAERLRTRFRIYLNRLSRIEFLAKNVKYRGIIDEYMKVTFLKDK